MGVAEERAGIVRTRVDSAPAGSRHRRGACDDHAVTELDAEDAKIVTLARAARGRIAAAEGAAVRDTDGRTYAAATVALPSLQVSAIEACVAMAVSSGSRGLEAAVLLTGADGVSEHDLDVLRDFAGAGVPVHLGDPSGSISGSSGT